MTNRGATNLTVSAVALVGINASSYRVDLGTCSTATLHTGESCISRLRFVPQGTGTKTASMTFADDAIGSPQTVTLSGTGTPGPWLERSAQGLKFGHVRVGSTTAPQTVTLTNIGSAPTTITKIAKEGIDPADFSNLTQTCTGQGPLDPGDSCTAAIAFRPTSTGTRTATLTITDTAPRNPHHVSFTGTGT